MSKVIGSRFAEPARLAIAPRVMLFRHQHIDVPVLRHQADRFTGGDALLAASHMFLAVLAQL